MKEPGRTRLHDAGAAPRRPVALCSVGVGSMGQVSARVGILGRRSRLLLAALAGMTFAGSTAIGPQDFTARLASQPGVAERARLSILGNPPRTLQAATFAWPSAASRMPGTAISPPPTFIPMATDINRDAKTDSLAPHFADPIDADPLDTSGEATPESLAGSGTGTGTAGDIGHEESGIATGPSDSFAGAGTEPDDDSDDAPDILAGIDADASLSAGDPTGDPRQLEQRMEDIGLVPDGMSETESLTYDIDPALPLYRHSAFIFGLDQDALPPQPFMHSEPSAADSGMSLASKSETPLPPTPLAAGPSPAERLGLTGKRRARAAKCLAEAIYFESRGEPKRGQIGVAQVVMNRVFSGYYPADICRAVYQNAHRKLACQFTFACDGIPDVVTEPKLWQQAREIADDVLDGRVWDEKVGRATHYHARSVRPNWIREMRKLERIGEHTFYRPRRWTS